MVLGEPGQEGEVVVVVRKRQAVEILHLEEAIPGGGGISRAAREDAARRRDVGQAAAFDHVVLDEVRQGELPLADDHGVQVREELERRRGRVRG